MAERSVDIVADQLSNAEGMFFKGCFTDKIVLGGGNFKDEYDIAEFAEQLEKTFQPSDITSENIYNLIYRYGRAAKQIIERAQKEVESLNYEALLNAELRYSLDEESATNLSDFFVRRTGKLYFEREAVLGEYNLLKEKIEKLLNWDAGQKADYHHFFMNEYKSAVHFN